MCTCRYRYSGLDRKVYGANMRSTWGRQDPGGPHVGTMNLAISRGFAIENHKQPSISVTRIYLFCLLVDNVVHCCITICSWEGILTSNHPYIHGLWFQFHNVITHLYFIHSSSNGLLCWNTNNDLIRIQKRYMINVFICRAWNSDFVQMEKWGIVLTNAFADFSPGLSCTFKKSMGIITDR